MHALFSLTSRYDNGFYVGKILKSVLCYMVHVDLDYTVEVTERTAN